MDLTQNTEISFLMSPTPVPRRKALMNHCCHQQQTRSLHKHKKKKFLADYANSETSSYHLEESVCFLDHTQMTQIINETSTNITTTTASTATSNFISRTMPLPRKPRKQLTEPDDDLGDDDEQDKKFKLSLNSTALSNHLYMNTQDFMITPGLSIISSSSNPFNSSSQQRIVAQSTLKLDRYVKLQRPNAPPPPPPKSKPDLIDTLSALYLNKSPESTQNTTTSSDSTSTSISLESDENNKRVSEFQIGFKQLLNETLKPNEVSINPEHNYDSIYCQPKFKIDNTKFILNLTSVSISVILFLVCILFISLFQTHVHQYYRKFQNYTNSTNLTSSNSSEMYFTAGSNLVKQTVLFCNGPYSSYQMNNLIMLPFSVLLVIIFSFFNQTKKSSSRRCTRLPRLLPSFNPFQRRNRLLVAALFCIIANEIFKMIESSMFDVSNKTSFNTTSDLLTSILASKTNNSFNLKQSDTDLIRVGFGLEPSLMFTTTQQPILTSSSHPLFQPSVLRFSKARLVPKLRQSDFTTIATTNLYAQDQIIISNLVDNYRSAQMKSNKIIESFNKTLNGSSSKTLFEVSMSLYQNEYVQRAVNTLFINRKFKWSLIWNKLETMLLITFEVFVIGMRYYPLIGIMDTDSLVCLSLASFYMWFDIVYNLGMTGLCEGLKLNISFDLLQDLRHIFGVGFMQDVKKNFHHQNEYALSANETKLLFSTARIVYSIVKSLPHFFCLAYVTVRFTSNALVMCYQRFNKSKLIIRHRHFNLIYTKYEEPSSNFDVDYVRNLFNKNNKPKKWYTQISRNNQTKNFLIDKAKCLSGLIKDNYFRYSTRIICTYTVCFTLLYYLTCFLIFYGSIFIDVIYFPYCYKIAIMISTFFTSIICWIQLIISMKQFKLHLRSLYLGTSDKYITPKNWFSNKKLATNSFNYAGFAVAFTCCGYFFLFILITFVSFQITTVFSFGSSSLIGVFLLVIILPFAVSMALIKLVNKFISTFAAKYCFVQTKSLAVKNLKSYSLFLYFKFFYDCFTSMAFCLIRMLKSFVMGILFMPRLDYSFMGRGLEKLDPAFMSYIGYLHWESHHTNSIVISFCDLLKNRNLKLDKDEIKRNRIINRWQLTYLLIKSKKLISFRRH